MSANVTGAAGGPVSTRSTVLAGGPHEARLRWHTHTQGSEQEAAHPAYLAPGTWQLHSPVPARPSEQTPLPLQGAAALSGHSATQRGLSGAGSRGGPRGAPGPPGQHVSVLLTQMLDPASCPPPTPPAGTHRRSLDPRTRDSSSSPPPPGSRGRSSRSRPPSGCPSGRRSGSPAPRSAGSAGTRGGTTAAR